MTWFWWISNIHISGIAGKFCNIRWFVWKCPCGAMGSGTPWFWPHAPAFLIYSFWNLHIVYKTARLHFLYVDVAFGCMLACICIASFTKEINIFGKIETWDHFWLRLCLTSRLSMVLKLYVYQLVDSLSRFSGSENWTVLLKRSVVIPHVDPTLMNNMLAWLQVLKKLVCPVEEIGYGPTCRSHSLE